MPDQGDRIEVIKRRMANRDRAAGEGDPGAPAQPAPPPQPPAQPDPGTTQDPQVPSTEPDPAPAPPQPDPEMESVKRELAETREALKAAAEESRKRQEEMQAMIAAAQEKAKLPTAEELDGMDQGEAIRKMAEAMTAQMGQQFQGFKSDLERTVLQPTRETVSGLELQQKRQAALEAYPGADMNKYGKAFDDMLKANPSLTPAQALKAVADPRDLSTAPAQPTNSTAPSVPAGAHMEQGPGGRATATQSENRTGTTPTVADQLARSHELRAAGDRYQADEVRRAALKSRLVAQGKLRGSA